MEYTTVLGFDFGMRYIGVAVGNTLLKTANPETILLAKNGNINQETLKKLLEKWKPDYCVVGEPKIHSNQIITNQNIKNYKKRPINKAINKFATLLEEEFNTQVFLQDESYSSLEAKNRLKQAGLKTSKIEDAAHSYAAKIILEDWMAQNS